MTHLLLKYIITYLIFFPIVIPDIPASMNVGTTLFSQSDLYKKCWSPENIAILRSRMILEDLLPGKDRLVITSNDFIDDIVLYFRLILKVIGNETYGKMKHIALLALSDLLGGYLNHALLPVAKHSYYAGVIDYVSIERLIQLFDELKWFLRTNGQGWTPPIPQNPYALQVETITVHLPTAGQKPCNGLIIFENVHLKSTNSSNSTTTTTTGAVTETVTGVVSEAVTETVTGVVSEAVTETATAAATEAATEAAAETETATCNATVANVRTTVGTTIGVSTTASPRPDKCPKTVLLIPLPYFDNDYAPTTIAVPFRAFPLRNIESRCAAYVIRKYYIAGHKCIMSRQKNESNLRVFNNNLYTWLVREVVPKMNDEKFYAAFGGVMRVVNTLKKSGATEVDLGVLPHNMKENCENKTESCEKGRPIHTDEHTYDANMIIVALLIPIVIWVLVGPILLYLRIRRRRGQATDGYSGPSSTTSPRTPTSDTKSPTPTSDAKSSVVEVPTPTQPTKEPTPPNSEPAPEPEKPPESQPTEGFEQVYLSEATSRSAYDTQKQQRNYHPSLTSATQDRCSGSYVLAYTETSSDESTSGADFTYLRSTDTEGNSGVPK